MIDYKDPVWAVLPEIIQKEEERLKLFPPPSPTTIEVPIPTNSIPKNN